MKKLSSSRSYGRAGIVVCGRVGIADLRVRASAMVPATGASKRRAKGRGLGRATSRGLRAKRAHGASVARAENALGKG